MQVTFISADPIALRYPLLKPSLQKLKNTGYQFILSCTIRERLYSLVDGGTITVKVKPIEGVRKERSINRKTEAIDRRPFEPRHGLYNYTLGIIADLDKKSKRRDVNGEDEWFSYLRTGNLYLRYQQHSQNGASINITWNQGKRQELVQNISFNGRAMEFSELIVYQLQLLTCDDQSGIVYKLLPNFPRKGKVSWRHVKWLQLPNVDHKKGFKCEWAAEKDGNLWVGSHGREGMYDVHEISPTGTVKTHDWYQNYKRLAASVDVWLPEIRTNSLLPNGYVTHESAGWDSHNNKWVFLPRKISKTKFDPEIDMYQGSNQVIVADEDFKEVSARAIAGHLIPTHGVSSFKWIPLEGTNNKYIVALKTVESTDGRQETYILAFDTAGNILFPETKIEDNKYEGLEFI
ncbi:unnamed protein product [Allacma fusca]|uniref:Soluble calcium-activated nucleotidase 1 n=1 Tax=Allacma fusca TaxID=39272 RepID=A0A8J2PNQ1_9HEXA|nr:unnamed protein product [Allacma fusca]